MAVFFELVIDEFQKQFSDIVGGAKAAGRRTGAGSPDVRRPLRGLEIKDDTYAILKVVTADGREIQLFDSGSKSEDGRTARYANFILQSVSEARMEKQQIIETFGAPFVYFFGEAPRFLDVQAMLLNSLDFNWRAEWWENYDKYLRGTKLVEMGARAYLFYEENIVEGYILQAQTQMTSQEPMMLPLSFRFFVTNSANISFIGDPMYPTRDSVSLPSGVDLTNADAVSALTPHKPDAGIDINQQLKDMQIALLQKAALFQASSAVFRAQTIQQSIKYQQQQVLLGLKDSLGGSQALSDFLRYGLYYSPYPDQNISEFLRNLSMMKYDKPAPPPEVIRTRPLRELIPANYDEYTREALNGNGVDADFDLRYGNFLPVNGPPPDPIGKMTQELCKRGAKVNSADMYRMGMVPMTPGEMWDSAKNIGKGSAWSSSSNPGGLAYNPNYLPGQPNNAWNYSRNGANPTSQSGFGYGYGSGYNRSFGYTQGVGGSYGGGMGGSCGAGVGGGLGGYGSYSYNNSYYSQQGNILNQQFGASTFGGASGSPYGVGYGYGGTTSQTNYYYTAGIRPDGSTYSDSGSYSGPAYCGAPAGYGTGYGNGYNTGVFGGGADVAAVASMGAGVRGDGVFGVFSVGGSLNVGLGGGTGPGNFPANSLLANMFSDQAACPTSMPTGSNYNFGR